MMAIVLSCRLDSMQYGKYGSDEEADAAQNIEDVRQQISQAIVHKALLFLGEAAFFREAAAGAFRFSCQIVQVRNAANETHAR